ncbi:MAG: 3-methyl-2-oxobutanoate dehydrogenase subunit VorB [Bdellovibrionales bacterium RIFOXYD1_FULL_53_11]|nr:MAG: 3-methyl-2-oxobutanoate dehydrogenase subunit VorB [Bdellovibrionales bacterium RIFOXYD1_FULL_53_11]
MKRELIKGNEAVIKGAVLAGCTHYFGYPITPASEIAQAASYYLPLFGGTFIQAESEVAAINMVYGASSAGVRTMTASSGPGMSLKQEGISYLAGSELPAVIVDIMRAGPGLGNIWPEQSDYHQVVKGGGHGNYKTIVLAPNSAQEMCDLTILAFDLSDKYRCTAVVLTDGYTGQMMEPVEFPEELKKAPYKEWALYADQKHRKNLVTSIFMSPQTLFEVNTRLNQRYKTIENNEVLFEDLHASDAKLVIVAYGIMSRVAHNAIEELRASGLKVGLMRPKTLWPFPVKKLKELCTSAQAFLVAEMSNGQMLEDVKLAIEHSRPIEFFGTWGGTVPSVDELKSAIKTTYEKTTR